MRVRSWTDESLTHLAAPRLASFFCFLRCIFNILLPPWYKSLIPAWELGSCKIFEQSWRLQGYWTTSRNCFIAKHLISCFQQWRLRGKVWHETSASICTVPPAQRWGEGVGSEPSNKSLSQINLPLKSLSQSNKAKTVFSYVHHSRCSLL